MRMDDIYGHIAIALERGKYNFTQKGIAASLGCSLSTVNHAIKPLVRIGAVVKRSRGFGVSNAKKFLTFWAVKRDIKVLYSTYYPESAEKIESLMPSVIFTAYSGAKFYHKIAPSDYGEVYVYGDCNAVIRRFPRNNGRHNVFCLQMPRFLENERIAPLTLIYVDLFNIPTWYATEFFRAVEAKLDELLERTSH